MVHGAAFTAPERTDQVLAGFTAPADGLVHILCLHGEVNAPASQYGPITREQIAASGLTYLALGHVHQCSGLQRQGDSFWAYPGCPEGRASTSWGTRASWPARWSGEGVPGLRAPVPPPLSHPDGGRHRPQPPEGPGGGYARHGLRRCVPGHLHRGDRQAGIDLAGLTGDYRDRFYALELRIRPGCPGTSGTGRGRTAFGGFFLRELRARYDAAEDEAEREKIAAAVRFGLAALEGRDLG